VLAGAQVVLPRLVAIAREASAEPSSRSQVLPQVRSTT
jgi:hypothetical protein